MFPRISLLCIVLSNLAALASGQGPLYYTVTNHCRQNIDVSLFSDTFGIQYLGIVSPDTTTPLNFSSVNSGSFYTTVNGGTRATRAEFHANNDDDPFYYYVVKDVNNFQAGISITPSSPPDNGYCSVAQCDEVSCPFAFSQSPTSNFPDPVVGVVPNRPLYFCPFAKDYVSYDITFCPAYGLPQEPPPLFISPNGIPGGDGKCLRVRDGIYANGTPVDIVACDMNQDSQKWLINHRTTEVRTFGGNRAFCLDAGLPPVKSATGMKIWTCYDNLAAQTWYSTTIDYQTKDQNRIALVGTGQCLDLPGGQLVDGLQVQTWQCYHNNPNQIWYVRDTL